MAQAPHGTFGYGSPRRGAAPFEALRNSSRVLPWRSRPGAELSKGYLTSQLKGYRCYLYRAIDRNGNLVDSMLSANRDMAAAKRFFRSTLAVLDESPQQVTSDGHDSYPRAIRETLGSTVEHRCSAYLNRRIEQDHRGIKQRYYPMLGFGAFHSAERFCRAFEEVRQYFRPRRKRKQFISLSQRRRQFMARAQALESIFLTA